MADPSRARVRLLFLCVGVALVAQCSYALFVEEPFPSLRGPRFGKVVRAKHHSGARRSERARTFLRVEFAAREPRELDLARLLPGANAKQVGRAKTALLAALCDPEGADAGSVAWLRRALETRFPAERPVAAEIVRAPSDPEASERVLFASRWEAAP